MLRFRSELAGEGYRIRTRGRGRRQRQALDRGVGTSAHTERAGNEQRDGVYEKGSCGVWEGFGREGCGSGE